MTDEETGRDEPQLHNHEVTGPDFALGFKCWVWAQRHREQQEVRKGSALWDAWVSFQETKRRRRAVQKGTQQKKQRLSWGKDTGLDQDLERHQLLDVSLQVPSLTPSLSFPTAFSLVPRR